MDTNIDFIVVCVGKAFALANEQGQCQDEYFGDGGRFHIGNIHYQAEGVWELDVTLAAP